MAKSSEICQLAINIVAWNYGEVQYRLGNTLYYAGTLKWCNLTWGGPPGYYSDAWHADCLGFVRACLCGWSGDKTAYAGGANIDPDDPNAYNCKYFNEDAFIGSCSSRSSDFTQLNIPCTLLYKSGHVGLYVGEFQLDGKTYNSCECCYGLQYGGYPTWTDPDGQRKRWKGDYGSGSYWEEWGIFNLNGTDYGITEYDGGATGATGFGSELSHEEVLYYWGTLPEYGSWLTYEYLVDIAEKFYGLTEPLFEMIIGWSRNEMYPFFDEYMGYLCDSIPLNGYMNGCDTQQKIVDWVRGTDPNYTIELFEYCAASVKNHQDTYYPIIKSMYLVLMNPCQRVRFCSGMDTIPQDKIIYQATINGYLITAGEYLDGWENYSYDITGTGVRGGNINPSGRKERGIPLWMYLKPYQFYDQYRLGHYRRW